MLFDDDMGMDDIVEIGQEVPDFVLQAYHEDQVKEISLSDYRGKWLILFFYPKDFTFVCPTELHAFQEKLSEFEKRNCQLVACSTDTEQSHWGWLQMDKQHGGIKGITYPVVADTTKTISSNYGVLTGEYDMDADGNLVATGSMIAYRGLFLIDLKGNVRHLLINDLPLGRNVDEAIRMDDSKQIPIPLAPDAPSSLKEDAEKEEPCEPSTSNARTDHEKSQSS